MITMQISVCGRSMFVGGGGGKGGWGMGGSALILNDPVPD